MQSNDAIAELLRNSGYFDEKFYKSQVHLDWSNIDPVIHFLEVGAANLIAPSLRFDLEKYCAAYPEVTAEAINPLLHFIVKGRQEGKRAFAVNDDFDKEEIFRDLQLEGDNIPAMRFRHKRIAIMGAFSKDYIIHDYLVYYLEQLKQHVDGIIFIADNYFPFFEILKIRHLISYYKCGRHNEYDFGSYKRGLELLEKYNLASKVNDVILCNDSVYGPVGDLNDLFTKMRQKNFDFWGIFQSVAYTSHIQSFFMNFNSRIVRDQRFRSFFKNVRAQPSLAEVVSEYELKLTPLLEKAGYKAGAFLNFDAISGFDKSVPSNPSMHVNTALQAGSHFIKRKAILAPVSDNFSGLHASLAQIRKLNPGLANLILHEKEIQAAPIPGVSFSLVLNLTAGEGLNSELLEALANQTYTNYEFIILTDNVDPATMSLVEWARKKVPSVKIRVASQNAIGNTPNWILAETLGDWIVFLNNTDIPETFALENYALAIAANSGRDFIFAFPRIRGELPPPSHYFSLSALRQDPELPFRGILACRRQLLAGGHVSAEVANLSMRKLLDADEDTVFFMPICLFSRTGSQWQWLEEWQEGSKSGEEGSPLVSLLVLAPDAPLPEYKYGEIREELNRFAHGSGQILIIGNPEDAVWQRWARELAASFNEPHGPVKLEVVSSLHEAIMNACGEYTAFLKPEDRWLVPDKLRQQTFVMRSQPDLAMCLSSVLYFDRQRAIPRCLPPSGELKFKSSFSDIMGRSDLLPSLSAALIKTRLLKLPWEDDLAFIVTEAALPFFASFFGQIGHLAARQVLAFRLPDHLVGETAPDPAHLAAYCPAHLRKAFWQAQSALQPENGT